MNKTGFYFKMALSNVRKNGKFYIPFLLISALSVAMFFNMYSFLNNNSLPGGNSFRTVISFGVIVIAFFCGIFMFYTNSFLIKRRKKELGIYNILGMEKRHIAKVITWETIISAVISIGIGIGFGLVFNKLLFMILNKLIKFTVTLKYQLHANTFIVTLVLFAAIFILILIKNIIEITKTKPIDLLASGNVGEKEPKVKWPITIIGIVSLLTGYIMAVTTTNALQAITLFFIAVILVIIGTYCLFISGSIAILKFLKKNKDFYYQPKHFSSVSGMLYRMKQNAVGLGNICILSTMVLVMISTTTSLYAGMNDIIKLRYPSDIEFTVYNADEKTEKELIAAVNSTAQELNLETKNCRAFYDLGFAMGQKGDTFTTDRNNKEYAACLIYLYTPENYKACTGRTAPALKDNEIAVFSPNDKIGDTITIFDETYKVNHMSGDKLNGEMAIYVSPVYLIVVKDNETFYKFNEFQQKAYGEQASSPKYELFFDVDGTDKDISAFYKELTTNKIRPITSANAHDQNNISVDYCCRQEGAQNMQEFYGGFLFLGIFLGFLFLMDTALIIYYKQLVEGYEDRKRFDIMQKVGMSRDEVKKSIKSQILIMFFLPLVTAIIHLAFAFPMLKHLLSALYLTNIPLYIMCTILTVIIYAIVYAVVYKLTAKTYYNIVSE